MEPFLIVPAPDLAPIIPHAVSCYTPPTAFGLTLGICIIVGTYITYLPQYYALWNRKSAEGLSLPSIALGLAAACAPSLNYMFLNLATKRDCCITISKGKCLLHFLDGQQLASTFICKLILNLLWLNYFKVYDIESGSTETHETRRKFKLLAAAVIASIVGFFFLNAFVASILNFVTHSVTAAAWIGKLIGFTGGIAVFFQWGPQIWKTWKLRSPGSLSVAMLAMQFPGGMSVIYFQAVVHKASWTTWFPYAVSLVQMTALLSLCVWFMISDKWFAKPVIIDSLELDGEESLLENDEDAVPLEVWQADDEDIPQS